jgi:RNA polymerase II-associated protein 2
MAKSQADPRHLEIALHHANIIQHRKDIENQVFENILQLTDFPLVSNHPADSPDSSDMRAASALLQLFRPLDWDNLIEERRGESKCGYVLCPNALSLPDLKNAPKFKFWNTGSGVKIVPREEVDKWCSVVCYRRALHVKAQLLTDSAWSRKVEVPLKFSFMGKNSSDRLSVDEEFNTVQHESRKLKLEDKVPEDATSRLVLDEIIEKPNVTPAEAPDSGSEDRLEGYPI